MLAWAADEFTARMFGAVNAMMLDVLAAVAPPRPRGPPSPPSAEQAKAKAEGRRPLQGPQREYSPQRWHRRDAQGGASWTKIQAATGCSAATVAKIAKREATQQTSKAVQGNSAGSDVSTMTRG
jgi:hypothetical protein